MTRSVRAAVGAVAVLVLLLVAAVSGLVTGVVSSQLRDGGWVAMGGPSPDEWFQDPVTVQAEVIDVDGEPADGWLSVDVVFDTEDGGREVVPVDLGEQGTASPAPPQVGDTIEVVHERQDPGYALRADDPALTGEPVFDDVPTPEEARAAGEALVDRTRVLALVALALAVAVGCLTAVAVRLAPPPPRWQPQADPQPSGTASARSG